MHIYFLAAISSIKEKGMDYIQIVDKLESKGHLVWFEHILNRTPNDKQDYPIEDDKSYYKIATQKIKYVDAVFAEISNVTPNIAFEISYALSAGIPVVGLYNNPDSKIPTMILGNDSPYFFKEFYTDSTFDEVISDALDKISDLGSDFISVPLSKTIGKYLDWVSKDKNISKSNYIRMLIEKELRKNTGYKKKVETELRK